MIITIETIEPIELNEIATFLEDLDNFLNTPNRRGIAKKTTVQPKEKEMKK